MFDEVFDVYGVNCYEFYVHPLSYLYIYGIVSVMRSVYIMTDGHVYYSERNLRCVTDIQAYSLPSGTIRTLETNSGLSRLVWQLEGTSDRVVLCIGYVGTNRAKKTFL